MFIAPSSHTLSLAVRLATVPVAMSAVELLLRRDALRAGGLLDFEIAGLMEGSLARGDSVVARAYRFLMHGRIYPYLLTSQLAVAVALEAAPLSAPLLVAVLGLHLLMLKRNHLSNDGSDDMVSVVLGATVIATLAVSSVTRTAWAAFLTGQLMLAYFVSGVSKAQSVQWCEGRAIVGVMRTRIFGHPRLGALLAGHASSAALLTRATFLLEALVPAALFAPRPVFLGALAAMLVFHLACVLAMGLGTFVWAFAACYPAALWSWQYLAQALSPGTRAACGLGWAVVVGALVAVLWSRGSERPRALPSSERLVQDLG